MTKIALADLDSGAKAPLTPFLDYLRERGAAGLSNENVAALVRDGDLANMEATIEAHVACILAALGIDRKSDHNAQDTPGRVARLLVREVCAGKFEPPPKVTDFPNAHKLDELYTLGPITVRSACAHHLCPIEGHAWIGVIPSERVIGISKFSRLTRWVMARPQVQEEATVQLADLIEREIKPRGLGVVVRARHACMTWRGVQEPHNKMTTSVMRGIIREAPAARSEFLQFVAASNGGPL